MRIDDRPATLYRLYKDEELLYVGISATFFQRLNTHRQQKEWFSEVNRITVEHYETRTEALRAEEQAIKTELPRYNFVHNSLRRNSNHNTEFKLSAFSQIQDDEIKQDFEEEELIEGFYFPGKFLVYPVSCNITLHIEVELAAWISFSKHHGGDEWLFELLRVHRGNSGIYIYYDALETGTYIDAGICVDSFIEDFKAFVAEFEKTHGQGVVKYWIERTERTIDFEEGAEVNKGLALLHELQNE